MLHRHSCLPACQRVTGHRLFLRLLTRGIATRENQLAILRMPSVLQCMSLKLASHAEEFHLRVLPKPCMNLSIHTASDVRLPTYKKRQCEKSVGLAQRTRANHSLAPQCRRRRRLNFQRAQRTR